MGKSSKFLIFLSCLLCLIFLFKPSLAAEDINFHNIAEELTKDKLHEQLEKSLGTDISVETYLQALDHLAHGETDKARDIVEEQGIMELLGLTVGSTGAGLIGAAWSFDKWVWDSCQRWADRKDKEEFLRDFLKPKVAEWKKARKIPDWRYVKGLLDEWFYDRWFELKKTKLFVNKDAQINQMKQEMWEHTRWVMGKLRQQFERERKLAAMAQRAQYRLRRERDKMAQEAKGAYEALLKATISPTENLIKKYLTDVAYRDLINRSTFDGTWLLTGTRTDYEGNRAKFSTRMAIKVRGNNASVHLKGEKSPWKGTVNGKTLTWTDRKSDGVWENKLMLADSGDRLTGKSLFRATQGKLAGKIKLQYKFQGKRLRKKK